MTEQDSFSQTLESYTSLVNDLLAESGVTDEDMTIVRGLSSQLINEAKEIEAQVGANEESVSEIQETVATTRKEQAQIRSRVTDVEESVESDDDDGVEADVEDTDTLQAGSPAVPEAECSLGQAIRLPEHVAEENLTQNQQRARSVAKDVHQYATSVPAGYRLSASELRRVLSAQEDGATIHGQTLNRVRDFLLRLGGEHVELKESRGGTTSVIFGELFVKRVVAWANHDDGHGAVTRGGVSG
jgi:chromosome segregation ATPase